jgi:hypothetical protein
MRPKKTRGSQVNRKLGTFPKMLAKGIFRLIGTDDADP